QPGFEGLYVAKQLSLVIGGAARMKVAVFKRRPERRRAPRAQGFAGNYVVVAIDDQRRTARGAQPRSVDDGIAAGRNDADPFEADSAEVLRQPGCAFSNVFGVFRL